MAKIWQILAVISVVILAIFLFYKFAEKNGQTKEIIKQQEQQIEIKNEVIETKKFQQKIISKTAVNVDANSRRQFLQFVFKERANPNQ